MLSRLLLTFFALSSLFLMLHARVADSETDPLNMRARTLLQKSESEKSIADPPSEKEAPISEEEAAGGDNGEEREAKAEAPAEWDSRKMGGRHSPDKSAAGGGVVIGGLVAAIFAAAYSYIRVTRRRSPETLT